MKDAPENRVPIPPRDDAAWIHDLRNAVNAVSMALHAADAMLRRDDRDRATKNILRAQEACTHLVALVRQDASEAGDRGAHGGTGDDRGHR